MQLRAITKLDIRNKTASKKLDDDAMSTNCDVVVTFFIYGRFRAIQNPDSGRIDCNVFINSNILSCKNWKWN